MNKPRVVIIVLLLVVGAVVQTALNVGGYNAVRPVSAYAYNAQIGTPTPAPVSSYTPQAYIPVKMIVLDADGATREGGFLCGTPAYKSYYGCTAFCLDPDPFINANRCSHEQRLNYPYGDESEPKVGVENDYLCAFR